MTDFIHTVSVPRRLVAVLGSEVLDNIPNLRWSLAGKSWDSATIVLSGPIHALETAALVCADVVRDTTRHPAHRMTAAVAVKSIRDINSRVAAVGM